MIDRDIPLDERLRADSDPIIQNNLNNLLLRHEEQFSAEEKATLRQAHRLMASVKEAMSNKERKRTRSIQIADRGKLGFERSKAGLTLNLTGSFGDESSTSTQSCQELRIYPKDGSCVVVIEDPTPL